MQSPSSVNQNKKKILVYVDPALHEGMKVLSKMRRRHIGAVYEEAIERYLDAENNPDNYLGIYSSKPIEVKK